MNSTVLSYVPSPVSGSNQHVILQYYGLIFPNLLVSMAAMGLVETQETIWKTNLDRTVGTCKNNLKCKGLINLPITNFTK
jgi:hypothetical protein